MNKRQKKFVHITAILVMMIGFFTVPVGLVSGQATAGDRQSFTITIQLPANRGTWATESRRATAASQFVSAWQPAHAIESRVILGTNANPGASTGWKSHAANQVTSLTHTSNASGSNVRAQYRTTVSRTNAFSSGGSWTP